MAKYTLFASLFVAVLFGCTKEYSSVSGNPLVSMAVRMDSKTETVAEENVINNYVAFFSYAATGEIVTCICSNDGSAVSRRIPFGSYVVDIFANCDGIIDTTSYKTTKIDTLRQRYVTLAQQDSVGNLFAYGQIDEAEYSGTTASISKTLKRYVAKVEIDEVCVDFSVNKALDELTWTFKEAYLMNVVDRTNSNQAKPSGHDKEAWEDGEKYLARSVSPAGTAEECFLYKAVNKTFSSSDKSYTEKFAFYAMPNKLTSDSRAAEWSPRFTRLVIVMGCSDGRTYYYPIDLLADGAEGRKLNSGELHKFSKITVKDFGTVHPDSTYRSGVWPIDVAYSVIDSSLSGSDITAGGDDFNF